MVLKQLAFSYNYAQINQDHLFRLTIDLDIILVKSGKEDDETNFTEVK